jgi:hypothetical protein
MTRKRHRILSTLSAAALLALSGAGSASAQGSGVHVDPGSPTGKEYGIPLEDARREAQGDNGQLDSVEQGSRTAPLFGEGVGDSSSSSSSSSSDGGSGNSGGGNNKSGAGKDSSSGSGDASGETVGTAFSGTRALQATVPDGGTSSTLTIGALAISVLLLGAVLGSIARRRSNG